MPLREIIDRVELAFIAWNTYPGSATGDGPGWAEFVVRAPTDVGGGLSVQHYSRSFRASVRNTMYSLG